MDAFDRDGVLQRMVQAATESQLPSLVTSDFGATEGQDDMDEKVRTLPHESDMHARPPSAHDILQTAHTLRHSLTPSDASCADWR